MKLLVLMVLVSITQVATAQEERRPWIKVTANEDSIHYWRPDTVREVDGLLRVWIANLTSQDKTRARVSNEKSLRTSRSG